mgnify:CR=1 FL=1
MKIIEPSVELINAPDYKTLLTTIEAAGRTCYKSEDKITDGSAEKFVRGIIKRGHEAVIELGTAITVRRASAAKLPSFVPQPSPRPTRPTTSGNGRVNTLRSLTLIC